MSPKYKLLYFDSQGRGEPIRFLLAYGNIPYEDVRLGHEEFKEKIKPSLPFGQVPVLEVDGVRINQTSAIARYIARELKITGKSAVEAALADAMVDTMWDMSAAYHTSTDEEAKKLIIPTALGKVDSVVHKNGGYLVGDQLTWADIMYASMLDAILKHFPDFPQQCPHLYGMIDKVRNIPSIKKWIAERPAEKLAEKPAA